MDTVTAFAPRRSETHASAGVAATPEAQQTLAVAAIYRLSEEGRKASLLAGGDGRAVQQRTVDVPVNRLHLVSVDFEGVACLKLRPRYERDSNQQVVRIDDIPTYDAPPAIEDLFRDAARNHQLEQTYDAERRAAKERRRDAIHERRAKIAEAFLADPNQRALVHPTPTRERCYISTENGRRVPFDVRIDVGTARDVPVEAHRRFRADLRARRDRGLQDRASQLALHEEKKRIVAAFIAEHGNADQRSRHEAGVLPMREAVEAITDWTFAALGDRPRYVRDGVETLQAHLRKMPEFADMLVLPRDLLITSSDVQHMTAAHWALVNEYRTLLPDATVVMRIHKIAWKRDPRVALPPIFGVLVTQRVDPFTLRREYEAAL